MAPFPAFASRSASFSKSSDVGSVTVGREEVVVIYNGYRIVTETKRDWS